MYARVDDSWDKTKMVGVEWCMKDLLVIAFMIILLICLSISFCHKPNQQKETQFCSVNLSDGSNEILHCLS